MEVNGFCNRHVIMEFNPSWYELRKLKQEYNLRMPIGIIQETVGSAKMQW